MSFQPEHVRDEIRDWFFNDYLPHGIAYLNGQDSSGGKGFQNYWGTPLLFTREVPEFATWLLTDEAVFNVAQAMNDKMLAAGYRDTVVPDNRIFAYNPNGGAVEVIWSRRNGDGDEIQRLAVHFEVAKLDGRWRFVAIHSRVGDPDRDQDSLVTLWSM